MPLQELRVAGYKCFSESTNVTIRPLTLFFGHNSAGKSALLRAIPLLAASAGDTAGPPLALRSAVARGAGFSDIRSRARQSDYVELGLTWSDDPQGERTKVDYRFFELRSRRRVLVETLRVDTDLGPMECVLDLGESEREQSVDAYLVDGEKSKLVFNGLVPRLATLAESAVLSRVRQRMSGLNETVAWLGAVRSAPERDQRLRDPNVKVGPDGSGATEILAYDQVERGPLLDWMNTWYRNATASELLVVAWVVDGEERYSLQLRQDGASHSIPIAHTGEGMSQLLPVVVLCAMARHGRLSKDPVLCIEQPELHMHPRVHGQIAELLVKTVAETPGARLVVETHAESLLLGVQLAVAKGQIDPADVAVHWVTQSASGESSVRLVELDHDGYARDNDWPHGVFEEDVDLARELAMVRASR